MPTLIFEFFSNRACLEPVVPLVAPELVDLQEMLVVLVSLVLLELE